MLLQSVFPHTRSVPQLFRRVLSTVKIMEPKMCSPIKASSSATDCGDSGKQFNQGNSSPKTDHLTRTSGNTREEQMHSVIVDKIRDLSKTVKEIVLVAEEQSSTVSFKAGQWVDVFIPNLKTVGGFSMFSSPNEKNSLGKLVIRLAIKYSTHPPALWMHKSCKVGDKLNIRVGGDFYATYDDIKSNDNILLVAGGVGINPLCSIMRCMQEGKRQGLLPKTVMMYLLYSAKSDSELLFKEEFDEYSKLDSRFIPKYFVTCGSVNLQLPSETKGDIIYRRMQQSDIIRATNELNRNNKMSTNMSIKAYVCGPPPMTTFITEELRNLDIENIFYEQWW